MKYLLAFFLLLCPFVVLAQSPPTPAQIQALQTAITQLVTDDQTAQTIDATVQSDVQAVIAAAQALSNSNSGCPTCGKGSGLSNDEFADVAEAVSRGFGSRIAIGPFHEATLAVRTWRAEPAPAGETDAGLARLQGHLNRTPRFTACQKATMAVIGLEMVNSFSPGTIPPQVLALAIQLQAQACKTPVPPVPPVPVPVPPVPVPVPVPPGPTPAHHFTGLKITPLNVRQQLHVRDKLTHAAFHALRGTITLPASLDLRGVITPIEDQGQCGSCHDFSGVGIVEDANIKAGNLTADQASELSEQYVLDTNPNGDGGCGGGDASSIFSWMTQQGGGVPLTSVYGSYQGQSQGSSQLSTTAVGYTISDWGYADTVTGVASVNAVKAALVTYGPVSVCIGCPQQFMNYSGGIITYDLSRNIDHQIICVGYQDVATEPGGGHWIVRNSWSTNWGDGGYFYASYASNPTTEAMYCVATKGQNTVIQAGNGPTPPDTPTHRASVLLEKGARLNKTNPAAIQRALKAAEDALQNAQ